MTACPRVMSRDQMVEWLQDGRWLRVDRLDAPELPELIAMAQEGLVTADKVVVEEQYGYIEFRWKT